MTDPAISVIMPAYNASAYIGFSINSVLKQTFEGIELIIIDDCSQDDTFGIASRIAAGDKRVKVIKLKENRGAPAAPRNIGIRAARGEWIAFLDADDVWHKEKLRYQLDALQETGAIFCSTRMADFIDEHDLKLSADGASEIEKVGFWKQLVNFRTPTSSVVAARSLLLQHPFNEDLRYKAREDLDCWLHCIEEAGSSIKLRAPLMGYRIIPGQISGSKFKMFRRHMFVLSRYRTRSGQKLGWSAAIFTASHFLFALYHRRLKRGM